MRASIGERLDGQVDAQDSPRAVKQLVERHRLRLVNLPVVLEGADHRPTALHLREDEAAVLEPTVSPRQPTEAGQIDTPSGRTQFVRKTHMGEAADERVSRVAGKVDARQ